MRGDRMMGKELKVGARCHHVRDPELQGFVREVLKNGLCIRIQWDGDGRATFVWAHQIVELK